MYWNIQPPAIADDGMCIKEGTAVLHSTLLNIAIPKWDSFMSQRISISIWSRCPTHNWAPSCSLQFLMHICADQEDTPVEVFPLSTELYTVTLSLRYLNSNRFCPDEISVYDFGDNKQKTKNKKTDFTATLRKYNSKVVAYSSWQEYKNPYP